jgi:DNA-binding CsgD family transcriptional regulator
LWIWRNSVMASLMDPGAVSRITVGQRDCLRLVMLHKSSKDIARELGISPHTVDQRLRTAIRTLGVSNRFEAARVFASSEPTNPYQRAVYQSPHVAPSAAAATLDVPVGSPPAGDATGRTGGGQAGSFRSPGGKSAWPLPFPIRQGERNELTISARLTWIMVIAVGIALGFGAILSGLESLNSLV